MKKASILSFQFADNFGAVLQIFALQKKLSDLGVEVEVINFCPPKLEEPYAIVPNYKYLLKEEGILKTVKKTGWKVLNLNKNINRRKSFDKFRNNHLNLTKEKVINPENLKETLPQYDYYFVGSDQVWNPLFFQYTRLAYFLDFAPKNSKKISYAASIAQDFDEKFESVFINELPKFDFLSVREESAQQRLGSLVNIPIKTTLDPTLLLTKEQWLPLTTESNKIEKFILVYDLQESETIIELTNKISEETGLKIISYSKGKNYKNLLYSFSMLGPSDFLNLYNQAEIVITSSFHGTAFSVIFEKEFYTVPHSIRGSRMIDLLNQLGLEDRIITDEIDQVDLTKKINYIEVLNKLEDLKAYSEQFIEDAIKNKMD